MDKATGSILSTGNKKRKEKNLEEFRNRTYYKIYIHTYIKQTINSPKFLFVFEQKDCVDKDLPIILGKASLTHLQKTDCCKDIKHGIHSN